MFKVECDKKTSSSIGDGKLFKALIDKVSILKRKVIQNSARSEGKFEQRGQMLPRVRISALIDRGTQYFELSELCGLGMHDDDGRATVSGGNVITAIATISGIQVMLIVNDAGIKGGTLVPMGVEKILRAQQIALENRLPTVYLVESGGAHLDYQSDSFVRIGKIYANMSRQSAAGLPSITVVHGHAIAGGAYVPGLSDYVIMVKDQAKVYLAGPALVKSATGETITDEELGGANMHCSVSGLAEYLVDDDAAALAVVRDILHQYKPNFVDRLKSEQVYMQPKLDIKELLTIVPVDYRQPYPVSEVILRLVDASKFTPFKPEYGKSMVTGQAHIYGVSCGILANEGPIDAQGAAKAAQFIQLCCQGNMPLLFLQNTTGFWVGSHAERSGIIKYGAMMIKAMANAAVPKITLHIGAAFGAGYYAMCGREYDPNFVFAWPNSRLAVMGGEQAAEVMCQVKANSAKRRGEPMSAVEIKLLRENIVKKYALESSALYATARLWDDGIIDPRDSRQILGMCLQLLTTVKQVSIVPSNFGAVRI